MKTNKKYALIINEALRSALDYDTPEEQINEFIRFFGKHIGSDRIYIFEDDLEKSITNNSYEWCADGVEPQINLLQAVEMEQIDWWYEAFDKEQNIIIKDMETIKDEHPASYELLKGQNIQNLVVSPLRYKDSIHGFFGVDNPPEGDLDRLSIFLEMIGTLLVSLLKLRNSFHKSTEDARFSGYTALSQIYLSMHMVNIKTGMLQTIKSQNFVDENLDLQSGPYFPVQIKNVMERLATEKYKRSVFEFTDIATLAERMKGKETIVHEFLGTVSGWCKERFIKVDEDNVLYCVEVIDEEKKRENWLLYLSETDRMTGICNRGCGERKISEMLDKHIGGLLCLIDCDKFKAINDTYGHAVGDRVLYKVGHLLKSSFRENDIVGRIGGDEFLIFMEGITSEEFAVRRMENLQQYLRELPIEELEEHTLTCSMGAAFMPKDGTTFEELYKQADEALYTTKRNGRDGFRIYHEVEEKEV